MTKQEYISLFNALHPNFFESQSICDLPEDSVYDEMILSLSEFDVYCYDKKLDDNVSFGFYKGDLDKIKKAAAKVEESWAPLYDGNDRIFCGYIDGEIASFCMIEDMGVHEINGRKLKIGGPGCVGTLPKYRNKGIGLIMVKKATKILKDEGYDYSYIHYTGVAPWYEKLGYKTTIKWSKNGIK